MNKIREGFVCATCGQNYCYCENREDKLRQDAIEKCINEMVAEDFIRCNDKYSEDLRVILGDLFDKGKVDAG